MKHSFSQNLSGFMNGFVKIFFAGIILYLTLLSGFSTAAVTLDEHTFIFHDSIIQNLLAELVTLVVLLMFAHFRDFLHSAVSRIFPYQPQKMLLCLGASLSVLFILATQWLPNADQRQVYETVHSILTNDSTPFEAGGYLEMYPYQSGIILFSYLMARIFGEYNYLAFQCLNILAFIWMLKSFGAISALTDKASLPAGITVLSLLFIPFLLYVNFIYGTMIGLALCIASYHSLLMFRKDGRIRHAVFSVISMLCAVMIKNNYMIFLIAIIIYLFREALGSAKKQYFFLVIAMMLVLVLNGPIARKLIEQVSGQKLGKGVNSWSWVAMGLNENDEKYNGWWSHYTNGTYRANGFDHAAQGEAVKKDIQTRLDYFKSDPRKALNFFAGKNASQWSNPDFQAFCFNAFMLENEHLIPVKPIYRFFSVSWSSLCDKYYLNYLQFIILFGVLYFLLLTPFQDDSAFLYELIVIGGFLFHTVWEAKGQYTFTYFVLFIPLSISGYHRITTTIRQAGSKRQIVCQKPLLYGMVFFSISAIIIASGRFSLINNIFRPENNIEAYEEYVKANTYIRIPEGQYRIHPVSIPEKLLSFDSDMLCTVSTSDTLVALCHPTPSDAVRIQVVNSPLCLQSPCDYPEDGQAVTAAQDTDTPDSRWYFVAGHHPDQVYILFRNSYALTLSPDDRIVLMPFSFGDDQLWQIEKL